MNKNQYLFFPPQAYNKSIQSGAININKNSMFSTPPPSYISQKSCFVKKRTYNELMESYKQKNYNLYNKESEEKYKSINNKLQKEWQNLTLKSNKKLSDEIIILKNNTEKKKEIKLKNKKFAFDDDDIDVVEKDFMCEREKNERKHKLSKSYFYDEGPTFLSDLEDTKENSISSLNFSFDYPDINYDSSIKNKLISNAIELEKTFHRIFNVKNMPNKK